jgi:methionyl-tRNA formyltransferase
MKIAFFGSPLFAVPTLKALQAADDIEIARVFTQPDKPAGRGKSMRAPAVKTAALDMGLSVEQPGKIRGRAFRAHCEELGVDAFVVVAFGKIFPGKLLAVPPLGCVNLHSSLLPELRGAAPINWAIVRGKTETGVTSMLMDEGLDSGPILLQESTEIGPAERTPELAARLAAMGAPLMVKTLRGLEGGTISPREQDDSLATHAPLISKDDGLIDWNRPAEEIYNQFRGFYPWPGVVAEFRGQRMKIKDMKRVVEVNAAPEEPGLLVPEKGHLYVTCGDGMKVELLSVQLPGKQAVNAVDFINGMRLQDSEKLTGFFE